MNTVYKLFLDSIANNLTSLYAIDRDRRSNGSRHMHVTYDPPYIYSGHAKFLTESPTVVSDVVKSITCPPADFIISRLRISPHAPSLLVVLHKRIYHKAKKKSRRDRPISRR